MLNSFGCFSFFIESNSKDCVTICMLRLDQQGRAKMLDCRIEFPFLKQSTAEAAPGQKVIRPYRQRFLVMHYGFVDPFLLKKNAA